MNDIKMPRWLTDKVAMVLAMHPTHGMSSRAVLEAAKRIGWGGSAQHCRKTLCVNKAYFHVHGRVWTLTAVGHTLQRQILRDMRTALDMHNASPPVAYVYRLNGEGNHVCVECGCALGMAHAPDCTVAVESLDADVTKR